MTQRSRLLYPVVLSSWYVVSSVTVSSWREDSGRQMHSHLPQPRSCSHYSIGQNCHRVPTYAQGSLENRAFWVPGERHRVLITLSPLQILASLSHCVSHTLSHSPEMPCLLHSDIPTKDGRPDSSLQKDGIWHTCLCAFASAIYSFNKHVLCIENIQAQC